MRACVQIAVNVKCVDVVLADVEDVDLVGYQLVYARMLRELVLLVTAFS